ncbi:Arrestin domain-containing protein 1 [Orchesella cincta]|uniref:Arrestin domain-containing protein 1 n=1 Tax=Orchesella cincta TaxID=48709 RepID=A0A1D2N8N8_ORCCI|nr:Arrestin domain-containing protein 1 [Orchesella cincta]
MPRACQNSEGKVFYTAEATLKRPSIFQSNVKESEDFFMLTNVNLNSFPEAEAPGKASDSWSNTFACCLKKSRVLLTCSTPYKGVCPGKMIPFQITVKNQTGREVKNVKVELVQKWVYWCSGNTKRVNVIVKKIPRTFQVPARCDLEWKDSLRVPADLFQPTQGTNLCRVINVDYVLRFTPIQDFTCCNVPVIEIPIYIGDIPLAKHTYSDAHIQFHGDHKNVHIRQGDGESDLWRKSNMSVVRKSNHSIHKKK